LAFWKIDPDNLKKTGKAISMYRSVKRREELRRIKKKRAEKS